MTELNTDNMSLSQLKELAEAQALEANPEPEETVYRRTVTNFDGTESTYEGADMESLLDAVIQGRAEHQPAPAPVPKELTADEEFVLAQEMASSPSKAFRKLVTSEFGAPVADVKARLQKLAEYEANQSAETYVASTPVTEFFPCPANGKRVQESMRAAGLEITVANISATVKALDAKGLLEHAPVPFDPYGATLEELKAKTLGLPVQDSDGGF